MILAQKIKILSKLGEIMRQIGEDKEWTSFELGINKDEYNNLVEGVEKAHIFNGWFTPAAVRQAFNGIGGWLTEEKLTEWIEKYPVNQEPPKRVALIMAGNIPLVGFHDFIATLLSGHRMLIKLSSNDQHLFPALLKTLVLFDPEIENFVEVANGKLENFDAVIATGSNNSANYFESYFGKYPHIIRKNRTSIAVLDGSETTEELAELGKDVFTYFGLGCRNVSQVWIPSDFNLDRMFEAFFGFGDIINHHKYANNYDYNKAVNLMNRENLLDNGFLLVKENESLNSPLGMLHIVRYDNAAQIDQFIADNDTEIQVVIGKKYKPFGQAQNPDLLDYADRVDTLKFLTEL